MGFAEKTAWNATPNKDRLRNTKSIEIGSLATGQLILSVSLSAHGQMFGHGLFAACDHFDGDAETVKALTLRHVRDAMAAMLLRLDALLDETAVATCE